MASRHPRSNALTFAKVVATLCNTPLEQSPWRIARLPFGARRREMLMNWLATPDEQGRPHRLPVNCRWQMNLAVDPDLQLLVKQGKLVRQRDGGSRRHPMNKSSRKRQTYLVLPQNVGV